MLMKKICLLLIGLLAMFSCEQENLEGFVQSGAEQVQTRAATSSIADFNQITELDGIPVNVLNVGNTSCRYLSAAPSNNVINLFMKDGKSLRQRWYVRTGNLVLAGGNTSISSPPFTPIIRPNGDKTEPVLVGATSSSYIPTSFSFVPLGTYYNIKYHEFSFPSQGPELYLQADTRTGPTLKFKTPNSSDLALWEFVPVGNFRLVNVQYEKVVDAGDFVNRRDISLQGAVFPSLPNDVEHTITVSETIRESSTFTETSGITTQEQSSFNMGLQAGEASLPMINIGGSVSSSTTSSKTKSYAEAGGYDVTVSQTFKVMIPANTACTVEVLKMAYNTSLTYVATFEKLDGAEAGKKFRIKGKWNGIVSTFLYYNIYRAEDNKLIETRIIDEQ